MSDRRIRQSDRGERVPTFLVRHYIQEYLDQHADDAGKVDINALLADHPEWPPNRRNGTGILLLADATGINPATLYRWLSQDGTVGLYDVDAILVACDNAGAWQTDLLLASYRAQGDMLPSEDSYQEGSE